MKKTYIVPTCEFVKLNAADIIATSGGVGDGGTLGQGFSETDITYGRDGDFWDDEDW